MYLHFFVKAKRYDKHTCAATVASRESVSLRGRITVIITGVVPNVSYLYFLSPEKFIGHLFIQFKSHNAAFYFFREAGKNIQVFFFPEKVHRSFIWKKFDEFIFF